jgi:dTDP-4-dehydrorhamnose reductase
MKIIITGAGGQLGKELVKALSTQQYQVFPYTKEQLDITNREQIQRLFAEIEPNVVINCAAFTSVDVCEVEVEKAYVVNGIGPYYLGMEANKYKAKLIHISTDYVFSGDQSLPYKEDDVTNPHTIYGKSKLLGEELLQRNCCNFLIIRTSWLYGHEGKNFVNTMVELSKKMSSLKVVCDQVGSPTYTKDVAIAILSLMSDKTGIYHVTNSGSCSWYEFAEEIMKQINPSVEVIPIGSEEYVYKTPRPSYSVLSTNRLNQSGINLRNWESALIDYLKKEYDSHHAN